MQISAVYGNAMKDRLYCEAPNSPLRRRSQTVMFRTVIALAKMLAPMIVFTADETWGYIPHKPAGDRDCFSVHLALWPDTDTKVPTATDEWDVLFQLRESALQQLDALKKSAGLNKASEAEAVYELPASLRDKLSAYGVDLEDLVGAGYHAIVDGNTPAVKVIDRRNDYPACARSWKRRPDVGSDPAHPDLSARDAKAIAGQ